MSGQEQPPELRVWGTPFSGVMDVSVSVIPDPECLDVLHLVVAPEGIDRYPKYWVKFYGVAAFKCEDESVAPVKRYHGLKREESEHYAYLWENSPWLQEFAESQGMLDIYYQGRLIHYVIFGGDLIIEVLSAEEPQIEEVSGPSLIVTYRV